MAVKLSDRGQVFALFAIVTLGCAVGGLSQTAVNSMMEAIGADFGFTARVGQWLTTIYILVLGLAVPVTTYLSRRLSMRNLVFLALGLFLVGSLVDVVAPSLGVLLAGRVLQAVSAGITMPLLQAIAMTRFPPGQRSTAMGVAGIAMGFAPNIGPTVGGAFVGLGSWHAFFAMTAACMVVLIACTAAFVPATDAPDRNATIDASSLLLSTLGFGGLLLGFSNAASFPLSNPLVVVPVLLGAVFVVAFVVRQLKAERPLIDMSIFRSKVFTAGFVLQCFLHVSYMGVLLVIPLYVMNLCGGTAVDAGTAFLFSMVAALACNPVGGILSDKLGTRIVAVCASIFMLTGAIPFCFFDENTPHIAVMIAQAVRAMGVSSMIGPLASWSMSKLEPRVMMDGSAFLTTVRQVCGSLGTAVMVFIVASVTALAATGVVSAALGYQMAFAFSALFAVLLLVGAIWKVR